MLSCQKLQVHKNRSSLRCYCFSCLLIAEFTESSLLHGWGDFSVVYKNFVCRPHSWEYTLKCLKEWSVAYMAASIERKTNEYFPGCAWYFCYFCEWQFELPHKYGLKYKCLIYARIVNEQMNKWILTWYCTRCNLRIRKDPWKLNKEGMKHLKGKIIKQQLTHTHRSAFFAALSFVWFKCV